MEEKAVNEGKALAWLSYLGLLLLIPLLVNKENEYSKFHVRQGIVLLIAWVVFSIASVILAFIPIIGWVIAALAWLLLLVLAVIGIVNALSGKATPLPVLGQFAEKIKI